MVILEAQSAPAMESTGRSAAGVRVQFTEEVHIRLSWGSIKEYQRFGVPVQVLSIKDAQSLVQFNPANVACATFGSANGIV